MKKTKLKLGICTGGGDCPGLNAALRAVVRHATASGCQVLGIRDGLTGLANLDRVSELTAALVDPILTLGGTILGTNSQGSPFRDAKEAASLIATLKANWRKLKLDGMIVIGGDGTQFMAKQLALVGLPLIGIPKTIDNDLKGSDQTIGFATAVDIASDAACRLVTSAEAHNRIMILEVMGRDGGHIAIATALASGAHAALLPEIPFSWEALLTSFEARRNTGKTSFFLVAAEGALPAGGQASYKESVAGTKLLGGIGQQIADRLAATTGIEARVAVLGHVQRGGPPNAIDRLLATSFGVRAVDLALAGTFGSIVGTRFGKPVLIPYQTLTAKRRMLSLNDPILKTAEATGLSLGR